MSSKADFLARYMTGTDKTKKKKKSKKSTQTTNIIVVAPVIHQPVQDEVPEEDPEDEMVPTKVNTITKVNKGFKRIDTGKTVTKDPETITASQLLEQPQTIYRDSSGRIVDINQRKQEFENDKLKNTNTFTELRLNEDEQQQQSKVKYTPHKDGFEDPMSLFDATNTTQNDITGDYSYTKGTNPVNRYHIKAGYFWDGVDRSNGFEQLKLRQINESRYNKIEKSINESYQVDLDD